MSNIFGPQSITDGSAQASAALGTLAEMVNGLLAPLDTATGAAGILHDGLVSIATIGVSVSDGLLQLQSSVLTTFAFLLGGMPVIDLFSLSIQGVGMNVGLLSIALDLFTAGPGPVFVALLQEAGLALQGIATPLSQLNELFALLPTSTLDIIGTFLQFAQVLLDAAPYVTRFLAPFGGIAGIFATLGEAMSGAFALIAGVGEQFIALAALIMNPWVLLFVGIAAALALLYAAWETNFGGIRDVVTEFAKQFQDRWDVIVGNVKASLDIIMSFVDTVWNAISAVIGTVLQFIVDAIMTKFNSIMTIITTVFTAVATFISDNWETIKEIFSAAFTILGEIVVSGIDIITSVFLAFLQFLKGDWGAACDTIKDLFFRLWESLKNILDNGWKMLKGVLDLAAAALTAVWNALWDALTHKVESFVSGVQETIGGIVKWIEDKIAVITAAIDRARDAISGVFGGSVSVTAAAPHAKGGLITQYLSGGGFVGFIPQGTDTVPAMLTPGEIVLNAAQQRNVARSMGGSTTVNVNFGAVSVRGSSDIDSLVDKIKYALTRELQLRSFAAA